MKQIPNEVKWFVQPENKSGLKLSKPSITAMRADVHHFSRFARITDQAQFSKVTERDVANWVSQMTNEGVKSSTIRRRVYSLRRLFRQFCLAGAMKQNPAETVVLPKLVVTKNNVESLHPDEVSRLLSTPCETTVKGLRDRIILSLIAVDGLRRNEILNLACEGIIMFKGKPAAVEFTSKSARKCRVALSSASSLKLAAYLKAAGRFSDFTGPVFRPVVNHTDGELNRPLSATSFHNSILNYYADQADIEIEGNVLHALRLNAVIAKGNKSAKKPRSKPPRHPKQKD